MGHCRDAACANSESRCKIGFPFAGVEFGTQCPIHAALSSGTRYICGEDNPVPRFMRDADAEPERQRFNQICAQEVFKKHAYLYRFESRKLDIALKPDIKFQPTGCPLKFGMVFVENIANPVPELQLLDDCRNELFRCARIYV